jgi:hypothetical protein
MPGASFAVVSVRAIEEGACATPGADSLSGRRWARSADCGASEGAAAFAAEAVSDRASAEPVSAFVVGVAAAATAEEGASDSAAFGLGAVWAIAVVGVAVAARSVRSGDGEFAASCGSVDGAGVFLAIGCTADGAF